MEWQGNCLVLQVREAVGRGVRSGEEGRVLQVREFLQGVKTKLIICTWKNRRVQGFMARLVRTRKHPALKGNAHALPGP